MKVIIKASLVGHINPKQVEICRAISLFIVWGNAIILLLVVTPFSSSARVCVFTVQ